MEIPITLEHAWMVDLKSTPKRVKLFSVSSNIFNINDNDRTAHFVGHYKLTPLDIIDFYNKKTDKWKYRRWNEGNGCKKGKNAYSEDDNFDEAIPIKIRK